jgi:tRNA(fMet)-specific endonuclease VapC
VDTDFLIDVSRNREGAIAYLDSLGGDWALSPVTSLELIAGAANQREVKLIDWLMDAYQVIPVNEAIGRRAYDLLNIYAKSKGLRTLDSLIAATAIEERRTLATRNRKHFEIIDGLAVDIPKY